MNINDMWNRLAQHQPFADELGHGPAWAAQVAVASATAAVQMIEDAEKQK